MALLISLLNVSFSHADIHNFLDARHETWCKCILSGQTILSNENVHDHTACPHENVHDHTRAHYYHRHENHENAHGHGHFQKIE